MFRSRMWFFVGGRKAIPSGGSDVRGFRPGRFGTVENDEDTQQIKQAKMVVYAERASAMQPLFDEVAESQSPVRAASHPVGK